MNLKRLLGPLSGFLLLMGMTLACAQQVSVTVEDPLKAAEQQNARRQALEQERQVIERSRQDLEGLSTEMPRRLETLQGGQLTEAMVEQARLDADSVRLLLQDLQAEIANADRRIRDLTKSISDLEANEQLLQNPAKDAADSSERNEQLERTRQALAQQRTELELENQHLANLHSNAELGALRLSLQEQWRSQVEEAYRQQQEQNRRQAQADFSQRLQRERQGYVDQANELRQRLEQEATTISEVRRRYLEMQIQNAVEQTVLIDLAIRLGSTSDDLARLTALAERADAKPAELQDGLAQIRALQGDLQAAGSLLQRKIDLYQQQKQVIAERREGLSGSDSQLNAEQASVIAKLIGNLNERLTQIQELHKQAEEVRVRLEDGYTKSLSKDLLARQRLPDSAEQWRQLLAAIATVPSVLLYQIRLSVESAVRAMLDSSALRWLVLMAAELSLLWLIMVARRRLLRILVKVRCKGDDGFLTTVALTALRLVRKNLLGIGIATALLLAVWMLQVPQPGLGIIMTLVLLWVAIKTPINLAWLLLASPQLPAQQRQPRLYWQWLWVLLSAGVLAAMTILARLSALPDTVIGAFDRLFMFQWLLASVPVLRLRRYLIDSLIERFAGHYWFVSLRVISLFLPLVLLGAAVLGLVGYQNLAWTVARHLVVFLAVALAFTMVRGLLSDLVIALKNYAVTHSSYGLLWTQDVINPLYRIVDALLFLSAWAVLFTLYGLELESPLVAAVWQFLQRPLFTLAGAAITLWGIALTVVIIVVAIRFSRWCRGVTYRWVFSRITDLGVRNSLSVFTQYFVVLLGLFITLRLIGINLTALAVFAGAVGVGIGFGMQNIANNFISGLLLLIERPLRSGDIVKIGDNEGEVTRIGIRSLTVKNWDNMEVIIPNSNVITNTFINSTRQDRVLRTVLMIRVDYDADPHQVKTLLEQTLSANPAVLKEPAPNVTLWEFSDTAVNFRLQYFIDTGVNNGFQVRTELLLAIWDNFKQEGISICDAHRVHVKQALEALRKQHSEEPAIALLKPLSQGLKSSN